MHSTPENYPLWLYRYWISLGLIVTVFAGAVTYMAYASGVSEKYVPAIFSTVVLLFVAGLLDIFYFGLATIKGEPYSFASWSAQYKWFVVTGILPDWTWTHQLIWTGAFLVLIILIWKKTLQR